MDEQGVDEQADPRPETVLIVAGGGVLPGLMLQDVARGCDRIIAADAGLAAVLAAGLEPDLVAGDFDSVDPELLERVPPDRRRRDPSQDETDLEKAIRLALDSGARRILLAGCTGDRLDHTWNAVGLMVRYREQARFVIHDGRGTGTLAEAPEAVLEGRPGDRVSLVPAPGALGVKSTGLKYPLHGIDLVLGGRDGVSNELVSSEARLVFRSGRLLVYRHRRRPRPG